ncbi:MAG: DUF192 domain-containing protein [Rhodobacteraceae bacterium]|nr:DUF192 domain-containing protein [Paracoccaceae bacterium]
MRHLRATLLGLVAALGVWGQSLACAPGVVDLRGSWGSASFAVDLALTPEEQSQGLMFVERMPRFSGMLFVFDRPRRAQFWMKNTLIPLDMIFIDERGIVTRVHENAVPGSLETIDGGPGVLAVLEINGGMSRRLGIAPGSEVRHPLLGEAAAWACAAGG